MPAPREGAAAGGAGRGTGTGGRAARPGPAPAPRREPPALLLASTGRVSSSGAACPKASPAGPTAANASHVPLWPAEPGAAGARLAPVRELLGPARCLLWVRTLCRGERGGSPRMRILSRCEPRQRRGTRRVLPWHGSGRAVAGACCRSELPRRCVRSHRVSPAWGQTAGRLARTSSLAVQAPGSELERSSAEGAAALAPARSGPAAGAGQGSPARG